MHLIAPPTLDSSPTHNLGGVPNPLGSLCPPDRADTISRHSALFRPGLALDTMVVPNPLGSLCPPDRGDTVPSYGRTGPLARGWFDHRHVEPPLASVWWSNRH